MTISNYKISLTFLHNSKSIDHYKLANTYRCAAISYDKMKNYVNAVNYFVFAGYVYSLQSWDNEQSNIQGD
jgi:hypothetical protein